ncbi:MAG: hypothetical protein ACNA7W_02445 [Pseudomonadales bacterium]
MRWLALTLITLQAATCGQSGRLTLPEEAAAQPAPAAMVAFALAAQAPRQALR